MTKDNYLFETTREKAVVKAQAICDTYVPGKVRVYTEYCNDTNAWYMVGAYTLYSLNEYGGIRPMTMYKREKMDRFYDAHIFTHFFSQRAAYMNASAEEQALFAGHPATYGMVSDSFARVR